MTTLNWNKAGEFASMCHMAHLTMQHMKKNEPSQYFSLHVFLSGSGEIIKERYPDGKTTALSFAELGSNTEVDPFRVFNQYFKDNRPEKVTEFINERINRAVDRINDPEYASEASWYSGRAAALEDVLAFLQSQKVSIE